MEEIEVMRNGELPLIFEGEELGFATSFRDGKDRWFEVMIYRTASGRYVVNGIGRSLLPGEEDRSWAIICEKPAEVIEALKRTSPDGVSYLSVTATHALLEAARLDHDLGLAARMRI